MLNVENDNTAERIVNVTNSLLELFNAEQEYLWNTGWLRVGIYTWANDKGFVVTQEAAVNVQRKKDLNGTKA